MKFADYWKSMAPEKRAAFAAQCGTSVGFLRNIAYGDRNAVGALCVAIEQASDGAVRRWDLRPDDWHLNWPELIAHPDAPPVPMQSPAIGAARTRRASANV